MASPGLKQGSIEPFMASFEDFPYACRRDEVVGERSCVVPPAFLLLFRSVCLPIHPPLNSTLSSNTACMSTRRNYKVRRMHRLTSSLPAYACHVTQTWSRDAHLTMEVT